MAMRTARRQPSWIDPFGRRRDHRRHTRGLPWHRARQSGERMPGERRYPQTLTVVADSTIAAAFAVDCGSMPTGSIGQWTAEAQPNNALLFDTWGSGPTDFFAAGTDQNNANAGVIEHYDGSSWSEQKRLPEIQLDAVWGTGPAMSTPRGRTTTSSRERCSTTMGPPVRDRGTFDHARAGRHPRALAVDLRGSRAATSISSARPTGPAGPRSSRTSMVSSGHCSRCPIRPIGSRSTCGHITQNLYVVGVLHGIPDPKNVNDQGLILHWDGSSWAETYARRWGCISRPYGVRQRTTSTRSETRKSSRIGTGRYGRTSRGSSRPRCTRSGGRGRQRLRGCGARAHSPVRWREVVGDDESHRARHVRHLGLVVERRVGRGEYGGHPARNPITDADR